MSAERPSSLPDDSLAAPELRAKALNGLRWVVFAKPATEVILLGSTVVLARLVTPAEFGRFAVAMIAGSLAVIPLAGVTAALVQRPAVSSEHLRSGVAVAWLIGLGLALLTLLAASLVVTPLYGSRTAEFVRLTAPLCLITAAGAVPGAKLQRRLAIRRTSVIELCGTVTRVLASIGMALAGLEGFALVFGWLLGELVEVAASWLSAPPPLPRLHLGPTRELLSFGLPASLAAASWLGFRNCDYAIIGARLGALQTGFYFRAYTLGVDYQKKISSVMNTVGFPALARTQNRDEREDLREKMVRALTLLIFPLLVLLAIEAPVVVPWLFGHRWAPAVLPTQILAVGGASTLVADTVGSALMASGRARSVMAFGWGHFVVYATAVFFTAPLGIVAVAIAASVVHTLFLVISYVLLLRGQSSSAFARLWHDVKPALVCSVAPAIAALPFSLLLRSLALAPLPYVLAVSAVGVCSYVLALRLVYPESFRGLGRLAGHLLPSPGSRRWRRRIEPLATSAR